MRFTSFSRSPTASRSTQAARGFVLPTRYFSLLAIGLTCLVVFQGRSLFRKQEIDTTEHRVVLSHKKQANDVANKVLVPSYQESKPVLRNPSALDQCRFYMAESAVGPNSGMGMFTATGLLKDEMVGFPDICIFVSDSPKKWTHLRSHSWGWGSFFGQYEGSDSRAACEGYHTIFNTMPSSFINTKIHSLVAQTTAGVRRDQHPAAGSITHHYGIHSKTLDVVPAGSELTVNYGDWKHFDDKTEYKRPHRTPEWLKENGWCIDHMEIKQSTIPGAGRGAFVKRNLAAGTMVAPAPLQAFEDRKAFQYTNPEQLYVNYCLQPRNSKMMFYPYGPGVNLINHASSLQRSPNVGLRWSKNPMHKKALLDMDYDDFWNAVEPGHLILEVYALRDLVSGEELLLDYGPEWQAAWDEHVANWTPPTTVNDAAESYVYPEDMDDTATLRTVKEQETNPYPSNLITMCLTPKKKRKTDKHLEWQESEHSWSHSMAFCHILDRSIGTNGMEEYTVSLVMPAKNTVMDPAEFVFDPTVPMEDLYIDTKVPRRAIRWIEKPYMDDEHLKNAFRHPIGLPDDLVPNAWRNAAAAPRQLWISPKS